MKLHSENGTGSRRSAFARAIKGRTAVLRDETGSTTEAIISTILSVAIIGIIAAGAVSSSGAIGSSSSNAERTQELNILTGKPSLVKNWDTAQSTAIDEKVTLPSGVEMSSYLWAVPSAVGVEYFASMARSGNTTRTSVCNDIATVHSDDCVYASAFHANDLRSIMPPLAPGLSVANLATPVQPRTNIATMPAPTAPSLYRFYVNAASIGAPGEIHIVQDGKDLGILPVQTVLDSYFGTIKVTPGGPVTMSSPDRSVDVRRVMIYKAGS
ncbi:hypothetical protein F1C58_16580 (plasmid) [Glaciihabitans sp. INWT7]|uniref:hypothetical protein n=1 Tax=Glaciihabitans sp. INWT7 TaxID=2596912 RepID=UPI001625AB0D|nr:hypothetical protein [Glaciihabitans sp. INWT7]QNE48673.1 hypothetical protein F1C58_16580 [Glaciihabitans sp. INWT7]